jgi:hypothetical protein
LDSLANVLREVEYESYQRRDTDSDKTGVSIVIDDPAFETPQVSHREVDSSVAHEPHHESMAKQLIQVTCLKCSVSGNGT